MFRRRRETRIAVATPGSEAASLRALLEGRGVDAATARFLAPHLEVLRPRVSGDVFEGVLAGIVLTQNVQRAEVEGLSCARRDAAEIERLVGTFGEELRKLDAALKLLSGFLERMRAQAKPGAPAVPKVLH
jgi:hypothetical protein